MTRTASPPRVDAVVVSTQHAAEASLDQIRRDMIELVIKPTVPAELMDENTKIYVNPTGRFVIGGPQGDSGLTGRKIIVDTYGGMRPPRRRCFLRQGPHQGGPLAPLTPPGTWPRTWWRPGLATKCQVQLAYAIGVAHPVIACWWTPSAPAWYPMKSWRRPWRRSLTCAPPPSSGILDLRRPIYRQLAAYGHMGREDLGVRWEATDRVAALKAALNG